MNGRCCSPNIGILRRNDRPYASSLREDLHHDTIPGRSRRAVGILVASHPPSDVRNSNVGAEKLDVGRRDGPDAVLELRCVGSRLELLEFVAPVQDGSRYVDEADVLRDESAQRFDVMPIPRVVPPCLNLAYLILVGLLGGVNSAYRDGEDGESYKYPHLSLHVSHRRTTRG
jgi:hypothetical protein